MQPTSPNYQDIVEAAAVLKGKAVETPLVTSSALDEMLNGEAFIKPECLQHTGSFKYRGAYNAISRLSGEQLASGVVASSSGNHAQGIASAANVFGAKATIIMPGDAPVLKVERTKALGADVVFFDREKGNREEVAAEFLEQNGGVFIHPFNNADVIAGQGSVGIEIAQQLNKLGKTPDRVLVCTGGGGLTAGVALAIHHSFPEAKINSVEPEGFDDYRRSLIEGKPVPNAKNSGSICDAILSPEPGPIGFEINRQFLSEGLTVTDEEAMQAIRFASSELRLVAEPGGAVALAALMKHASEWQGETVVAIISGGNIDPDLLARILSSE